MSVVLDQIQKDVLQIPYDRARLQLTQIMGDLQTIQKPKVLGEYTRYITTLEKYIPRVQAILYKYDNDEQVKLRLENAYKDRIDAHIKNEVIINDEYEKKINDKVQQLENEIKEQNRDRLHSVELHNQVYVDLERKRQKLEEYSDIIIDLCSQYGVTTTDVDIADINLMVDELNELYDQYLKYMQSRGKRRNIITSFRNKVKNVWIQCIVLLLAFLLCFTEVLNYVSILFFVYTFYQQFRAKKIIKYYTVLLGLLFCVKPMELGFKSSNEVELLPEGVSEESEEIEQLANEWAERLEEHDNIDPAETLEEDRLHLLNILPKLHEEGEKYRKEVETTKSKLLQVLHNSLEEARKKFMEEKSKVKLLGSAVSERAVFDTNFKLGLRDGCIEESMDIGLSNIVIHPSHDLILQRKFVQVLLANALCNVKINQMEVIVYDPNQFGQSVASFLDEELNDIIVFKHDRLDETITQLKEYAMRNLADMKGAGSLNDFNAEAERIEKTPREYKLLLVLSQPKILEENEALKEFIEYSAKYGVLIWMISNINPQGDVKVFREPFQGVRHPYEIDDIYFGRSVAETLKKAKEAAKIDILPWEDYIQKLIPEDKIWADSADRYIHLNPGYIDGDPTQAKSYTVGNDGNVHVLVAGTSGAGKSVFLNQLIATLTMRYSPRTCELWLADYKGSEFSYYLKSKEFPYTYPHIRTCLCTSDGAYGATVFKALKDECERRYNKMTDLKVKTLMGYNDKMRELGKEDECWPRIIFINDEFQNIFQQADSKDLEIIMNAITYLSKIGRQAGCHLLFASQSMQGTVSKDVFGQFSLRFCLRCDQDVSMDILDTKKASEIKESKGFLIVRTEGMSNEQQKKVKIPFIQDEVPPGSPEMPVLRKHIKAMDLRAKKEGIPPKDVISYRESDTYSVDFLSDFIESHKDSIPDYGVFFLGERMTYSENRAPDNIDLRRGAKSHLISVFADTADLVNFYRTLQVNIKSFKTDVQVFVNCQVESLHYLCEVDKDVPEGMLDVSSNKTKIAALVDMFAKAFESRRSSSDTKKPAYFILIGWDEALGFGVERDARLCSEFTTILEQCGEEDMHFIFINRSKAKIGNDIRKACGYGIAGKCDEDSSYFILDAKTAAKSYKLNNGYMFINSLDGITRAKIYQANITRTIEKKGVFMERR